MNDEKENGPVGEVGESPNGRSGRVCVTFWLTRELASEIDRVAELQSKGASEVTRSSLLRHWVTRGLAEARRGR